MRIENESQPIGQSVKSGSAARKIHREKLCLAGGVDAILSGSMQRWILLGLVAAVILGIAGAGGIWWMRQNRPESQWVPMPVSTDASSEERKDTIQGLERMLKQESVLLKIVKDLSLQSRLNCKSEQEAVDLLKNSLFVREGEFRNPTTQETFTTIDIGMSGKSKQRALLGEIAMRLAKETRSALGIPEAP